MAMRVSSADQFGVVTNTVKLWGKSFSWKKRIQERDLQVMREVASRTLDSEVSRREQSLRIVRMPVFQLAKAIAEGQVKMTLADLDRLVRLESFLSDEPDSRQKIVIGDIRGKTDEELRRMVQEELGMLDELEADMSAAAGPSEGVSASDRKA